MAVFLCPKLYTTFIILLNLLEGVVLGSITCFVTAVFFTINIIIFCVKKDVKLALIINLIIFVFNVLFLGFTYLTNIFSKYLYYPKDQYESTPYPPSFLDEINFKIRLFFIACLTLLFVANFTNIWIYKVNYDKIKH